MAKLSLSICLCLGKITLQYYVVTAKCIMKICSLPGSSSIPVFFELNAVVKLSLSHNGIQYKWISTNYRHDLSLWSAMVDQVLLLLPDCLVLQTDLCKYATDLVYSRLRTDVE